jgi:hypothetical protein
MLASVRLQYDLGYAGADMPEARWILDPFLKDLVQPPIIAWHEATLRHSSYWHEWSIRCRRNVIYEGMLKYGKRVCMKNHGNVEYLQLSPIANYFIVKKRVAVRYKKLNEDLTSTNVSTAFQEKLIEGKELDIFGEKGIGHIVTIGYRPNTLETDWHDIYAVEWSGDKMGWFGGLGDSLTFDDFDVPPPPPPPPTDDAGFSNLRFRNPGLSDR